MLLHLVEAKGHWKVFLGSEFFPSGRSINSEKNVNISSTYRTSHVYSIDMKYVLIFYVVPNPYLCQLHWPVVSPKALFSASCCSLLTCFYQVVTITTVPVIMLIYALSWALDLPQLSSGKWKQVQNKCVWSEVQKCVQPFTAAWNLSQVCDIGFEVDTIEELL